MNLRQFRTIYAAEMRRRLTSRAFQIGLAIGILGIWGLARLPGWLSNNASGGNHGVTIAADAALAPRVAALLEPYYAPVGIVTPADARASLQRFPKAAAAIQVLASPAGLRVRVYARDAASFSPETLRRLLLPLDVEVATRIPPATVQRLLAAPIEIVPVGSKFRSAEQAEAARAAGMVLITLLYVLTVVNSQLTMTSIAEEKTSRIAELLVSSVDLTAMLYAKIAASVTIAVGQLIAWGLAAALGGVSSLPGAVSAPGATSVAASGAPGGLSALAAFAFLAFFLVGLLQLSSIFAAAGSLINRPEDLGSIGFPLILPIMGALLLGIFALSSPDAGWVKFCSFLPFVAPFVMVARILIDSPPPWQVGLSLAINIVALVAIAVFAGRLYRVGMLLYGRAPTFAQVLKTLRSR